MPWSVPADYYIRWLVSPPSCKLYELKYWSGPQSLPIPLHENTKSINIFTAFYLQSIKPKSFITQMKINRTITFLLGRFQKKKKKAQQKPYNNNNKALMSFKCFSLRFCIAFLLASQPSWMKTKHVAKPFLSNSCCQQSLLNLATKISQPTLFFL